LQRSREELETMAPAELVERVLELQDMLREGLAVRDALHKILNDLLNAKAPEVARYAELPEAQLGAEELAVKRAWALTRQAVSNPLGAVKASRRLLD